MGINLGSVDAWTVSTDLPPGTYVFRPAPDGVERDQSSNGNEQVKVAWRVAAGEFTGAERMDWVTFTENAMGRVVQLIEACGEQVPQQDFASYAELADWVAAMLKKGPVVEGVVRLKEDRKGAKNEDGTPKMWPEIAGYRKPSSSDVPSDTSGFAKGPSFANGGAAPGAKADDPPIPF